MTAYVLEKNHLTAGLQCKDKKKLHEQLYVPQIITVLHNPLNLPATI